MKTKVMTMCLVVAVLAIGSAAQADSLFVTGGDRIMSLQNPDGGWGWPLTGTTADNTVAATGMGLVAAYQQTGNVAYKNAAIAAAEKAVDIDAAYTTCGTFLKAVSDMTGDPSYANKYATNFDDNAASVDNIIALRASQGFPVIAAWDLGKLAISAQATGGSAAEELAGIATVLNGWAWSRTPTYDWDDYDIGSLAGAVFAGGTLGYEFDPITGALAAANSTQDLADILCAYQDTNGGFYGNAGVEGRFVGSQETAYAILALDAVDPVRYATQIQNARNYLINSQLGTGGWESNFGENVTVTGEALWALSVPEPTTLAILGLGGLLLRRRRHA